MRPTKHVDLGFLDTAPVRVVVRQTIRAPREEVFEYLKDGDGWKEWNEFVSRITWTSPPPYGVGTTRTVELDHLFIGHEDFLLWEEHHRFVFRFLETNLPMVTALAEDFHFTDTSGGRCEVKWVIAAETALRRLNWALVKICERRAKKTLRNLAARFER